MNIFNQIRDWFIPLYLQAVKRIRYFIGNLTRFQPICLVKFVLGTALAELVIYTNSYYSSRHFLASKPAELGSEAIYDVMFFHGNDQSCFPYALLDAIREKWLYPANVHGMDR